MKYLVGSRALKINHLNSDYDIHECYRGNINEHRIMFMETELGEDVDIHKFVFESKEKLLETIKENSVQALLYKEFRDFWEITDEEAITLIEKYKDELRPYEYLYYQQQLLHEEISEGKIKEAYELYKGRKTKR